MEKIANNKFSRYASVILPELAIPKLLEYGIGQEFLDKATVGSVVIITVNKKQLHGIIANINSESSYQKVLPILDVLNSDISIPEDLFSLISWMSDYYLTHINKIVSNVIPAWLVSTYNEEEKKQIVISRAKSRKILRETCIDIRSKHPEQASVLEKMLLVKKEIFLSELVEKAQVSRAPVMSLVEKGLLNKDFLSSGDSIFENAEYFKTFPKHLNDEQLLVKNTIVDALKEKTFKPFLLHGITGSGKTEVYLQTIAQALELNLGTIVLVPEVALTVQITEKFKSRFEDKIAILHHKINAKEKQKAWKDIRSGKIKIVIGARSAIFSPMQNLGLIIVDEEHESSYKQQEEQPCYHARDIAVMRAFMSKATVVLGSATPSLESYHNVTKGKYSLLSLTGRAGNALVPKITVINMNKTITTTSNSSLFSDKLIEGIKKRIEAGEQAIVFLNRRGYRTSVLCGECGYIFKCKHCDITLTLHYSTQILSCHLCDFKINTTGLSCSECKQFALFKYQGVGTELVERALQAILPDVRTIRIDTDTTKHKGSYQKLFRDFATGKADLLIGTKMIAKGLHFPSVTLAGIINADSAFHIPDCRASENAFQMVSQVAGRSGRGAFPGEVIIQTKIPDNETIKYAIKEDYINFYNSEIEQRKMFCYPPFVHFIKIVFSGPSSEKTYAYASTLQETLATKSKNAFMVYNVKPAGYQKIKDKFYFICLLKGNSIYFMNNILKETLTSYTADRGIRIHIDVDPMSIFF